MTTAESALAVLIKHADWDTLKERMQAAGFKGEVVISEIVEEHLEEVEKLADKPEVVEAVPDEIQVSE